MVAQTEGVVAVQLILLDARARFAELRTQSHMGAAEISARGKDFFSFREGDYQK